MTLEMEALMEASVDETAVPKFHEALRELAASNAISDAQVVMHARDAAARARTALRNGDRMSAWREHQLAADLLRCARPKAARRDGPQTARGIPEPGDLIVNGDCPICGSTITVEHGDEAGEIVFLAHSNQQGRD